jgi:hypothetical protein
MGFNGSVQFEFLGYPLLLFVSPSGTVKFKLLHYLFSSAKFILRMSFSLPVVW